MLLSTTVEFLSARKQNTKNGEMVIVSVMGESETYEVWAKDETHKKKALSLQKGKQVKLTWKGRKFKGFLQVGELVGLE